MIRMGERLANGHLARIDRKGERACGVGMATDFSNLARSQAISWANEQGVTSDRLSEGAIFVFNLRHAHGAELIVGRLMHGGASESAARNEVAGAIAKSDATGIPPAFAVWCEAKGIERLITIGQGKPSDDFNTWLRKPIPAGYLRLIMLDEDGWVSFDQLPFVPIASA